MLLEKVHYIPGQDTLFLLGDLIEKGSASLETLRWVMTLARNERVIVLKGNNDEAEQLLEDKNTAADEAGLSAYTAVADQRDGL